MAEGITMAEAEAQAAAWCEGINPQPSELFKFWQTRVAAQYFHQSRANAAEENLAEVTRERDALQSGLAKFYASHDKDHFDAVDKLQAEIVRLNDSMNRKRSRWQEAIVKLEKERGEFRKLAQDRAADLVSCEVGKGNMEALFRAACGQANAAQAEADFWKTQAEEAGRKRRAAEAELRETKESLYDARGAAGLLTAESESLTAAYHAAQNAAVYWRGEYERDHTLLLEATAEVTESRAAIHYLETQWHKAQEEVAAQRQRADMNFEAGLMAAERLRQNVADITPIVGTWRFNDAPSPVACGSGCSCTEDASSVY